MASCRCDEGRGLLRLLNILLRERHSENTFGKYNAKCEVYSREKFRRFCQDISDYNGKAMCDNQKSQSYQNWSANLSLLLYSSESVHMKTQQQEVDLSYTLCSCIFGIRKISVKITKIKK